MQARLTDVLGLHSTSSRISVTSIVSFTENINTREAYKQFCRNLYQIGVTEDMIRLKEKEILKILRPENMAASSQISSGNIGGQRQLLGTGYSNTKTLLHTSSTNLPYQ